MKLRDLCEKYGSDKGVPDHAHYGRDYLDYYDWHLGPILGKPGNVLEIGVLHGASIRMWRDWFPMGIIHGVDINDVSQHITDEDRIQIHQGNQCEMADMERVGKEACPLKVIIDDGSHSLPGIFIAFETLWPFLLSGGWYVIEDLHHYYSLEQEEMFLEWFGPRLRNLHGRSDEIKSFIFYPRIFFIEKA